MDGLWLADIEIVLIHILINMLLMYRSGTVWLSKEPFVGSTAFLSAMHWAGIGLITEVMNSFQRFVKIIITSMILITTIEINSNS